MTTEMNLNGATRKELVAAISEITGEKAIYRRTPTYSYDIGKITVNKDGSIESPEGSEVIELLKGYGFYTANEEVPVEAAAEELIIEVAAEERQPAEQAQETGETWPQSLPVELSNDLTEEQQEALKALVESKKTLLTHALDIEKLPIEISAEKIGFPWFTLTGDPDEGMAYMQLAGALMDMVKRQKRITAKDKEVDNEKYAFRCFLLRLGFIGDDYKAARKIRESLATRSRCKRRGDRCWPSRFLCGSGDRCSV